MKISVDIRGIDSVKAHLAGLGGQVAYAASRALNATATKVVEVMPAEIERAIDRPVPFTKRGVAILGAGARKDRLAVTVGFRRAQAKYMAYQIEGGTRNPGLAGLKLPATINLNEFGNIPKGIIGKMVAVARKERKLTKVQSRRVKVSRNVELFYGDPTDQGGRKLPRGIYKAVPGRLIPLVVFPVQTARYRPIFDFPAKAAAIVARVWDKEFSAALADALRTAR